MKVTTVLACLVAGVVAAPAKLDGLHHHHHHNNNNNNNNNHHHPHDPLAALAQTFSGYNYEPPKIPSGLYELPVTTTTTTTPPPLSYLPPTTTTTTTPPPLSYLPPDEVPDEDTINEVVKRPDPTTKPPTKTTMMPMPYNINWGVSDPESGNVFNHVEDSDGTDVTGEYSVLLPDNRMQIVRFRVDPVNGYQAEVFYEPVK